MGLMTAKEKSILKSLIENVQELQHISNQQSKAILELIKFAHTHIGASGAITTDVPQIKSNESPGTRNSNNPDEGEKGSGSQGLHGRAEESQEKSEETIKNGHSTIIN